ncbi:hypothetical protein [Labilithrix luteola]|uniref:hypothetical protein n=1 Tax=Labilithrix luteola TaxID=1391654 RepID=UPI0011BAA772|nr:hypothetical protein [Labilithrix luteola]
MQSRQSTFAHGFPLSLRFSLLWGSLFAGSLLLSSACGKVEPLECPAPSAGSQPPTQDAATDLVPARDACDALAIAQMAFVKTCKGYEPPRDSLAEACRALTRLPGATVDDADLATCTKDIEFGARTCSVPSCIGYGQNFLFPGREHLWVAFRLPVEDETRGTLPVGAPCMADLQCASAECHIEYQATCGRCRSTRYLDQTCTGDGDSCIGGTVCSGGVCILVGGKEGESCATEPCQSDLYCQARPNGNTCVRQANIGESCVPEGTGTPCVRETSYCNFNTRRCTPLRGLDESCDDPAACKMGLTCSDQTCRPISTGLLDQACTSGCQFDLPCIDGICRRLPGTGQPEGASCDGQLCAAGLICGEPCTDESCNSPPTACRRFREGDPCTWGYECSGGMWCEPNRAGRSGVCRVLREIGESCEASSAACQPYLVCADGRCQTADTLCR